MSPNTCPVCTRSGLGAGWGQPFISSKADPEIHFIKGTDGFSTKRDRTPPKIKSGKRCLGTKEGERAEVPSTDQQWHPVAAGTHCDLRASRDKPGTAQTPS